MCRGADGQEVGSRQRGTTDQPAVHVRLREQFGGVRRLDATAIKQSSQTGKCSIFAFQLATNETMYLLDLLRRGGTAGADGPDWLVGDHRGIETGDSGTMQYRPQLARDDCFGRVVLALLQGFAHAKDRRESGGTCSGELARYQLVVFVVVCAFLGISAAT